MDRAVEYGLAAGKVLEPFQGVPSTQGRQDGLQGPVDALSDAVSSRVVGSGVMDGDVVVLAKVLEGLGDKLASVVSYQGLRHAKICHIPPQSLYYFGGVFGLKGEEFSEPGIVINDCKYIFIIMGSRSHVCYVNTYSFKGAGDWGEFLPVLL